MKVSLSFLLPLLSLVVSESVDENLVPQHTAYGYLENVAISEAHRIREAEETSLKQQRIVGGLPARPGQYPYQVGLVLSITGLDEVGICGGTVLNEKRVLTAAHCWYDGVHHAWKATVVFGSVTLFTGGVKIDSTLVVVHPDWNPVVVRNDIAIIYLINPVSFSAYIAPVSLPTGDELNEDFVGNTTIASGFGRTTDESDSNNFMFLNHVALKVISNRICRFAFPMLIQPSNICTVGFTKGVCHGDSGGPLVIERHGKSILVGVTSFGSSFGCRAGLPDVYTRITSFMMFIEENM